VEKDGWSGLQDSSDGSAHLMLLQPRKFPSISPKNAKACKSKHQQSLREHADFGVYNSHPCTPFPVDTNEFHSHTNWNRFFRAVGNKINKYGPRK
jgi:hypothetical protein